MDTPTLVTERLIVRRFTERDMEALFLILVMDNGMILDLIITGKEKNKRL